MDWTELTNRWKAKLQKYKYGILILMIGLCLMVLPTHPEKTEIKTESATASREDLSSQLHDILTQIEGAGKVSVLLTPITGEETIYQIDENRESGRDSQSQIGTTVIVTGAGREETGLVRQINPPAYRGAIVVCQGADQPAVKLAIVEAVCYVTGLRASRVSVLKMK